MARPGARSVVPGHHKREDLTFGRGVPSLSGILMVICAGKSERSGNQE
jgi:hypothetical protein